MAVSAIPKKLVRENGAGVSPELRQVQHNVAAMLEQIAASPIVDGILLKAVSLLTGQDNYITHGLVRTATRFIVVDKPANTGVWRSATAAPAGQIVLKSNANVVVDLWVF